MCLIAPPAAAGGYADQYGSGGYGAASRYGNYSDQYGARTPNEKQAGQGYADQFSGRPFQPPPPPPPAPPGLETATTSTNAPSLGALDPMKGLWTGLEGPAGGPAQAGSNATQTPAGGVDLSYGLSGAPAGAVSHSSVGDGLLDGLTSGAPANGDAASAAGSRESGRASDQPVQSGFADQYVSGSQKAGGKEPDLYGSPTPPPRPDRPWGGPDIAVAHAPPTVTEQGPLETLKDVLHNVRAALRAW